MTRNSNSAQVATYKGRKYRLAWVGSTKYGRRAKLQFFDGSREFWVPADAISVQTARESWEEDSCELCGRNKYTCGHCIGW